MNRPFTTDPFFESWIHHIKCFPIIFSKTDRTDGETDERFWDAMLKADREDYERICAEFGVKDVHLILKKLGEKKKERAQNKSKSKVWKPSTLTLDHIIINHRMELSFYSKQLLLMYHEKSFFSEYSLSSYCAFEKNMLQVQTQSGRTVKRTCQN